MFRSVVYHRDTPIGEAAVHPKNPETAAGLGWARELRVAGLSPPSDRCPPLAVLHTIAVGGVIFKLEALPTSSDVNGPLYAMYSACLSENKAAVVPCGQEELYLVAMASRKNLTNTVCFWGFKVPVGLYSSCMNMLNLRCLGIVFDLDETLIVANTTRSFEDRIDSLQRKVTIETDKQRVNGMMAEIKRYQEDQLILKQYIEGDQVIENGSVYKAQPEIVPLLSDNQQLITRPIIRLQEKNIVLTRINPSIRDTSVLVRRRPAWEDLRSYLIAGDRKRFEVFVCTMAERDYALEMWRLLDPDFKLISSGHILDRIVCVKAGLRKSLHNVFQGSACDPRMSLVIDDRLKVWDDKDQCRVHVVPAFTPYYAPLAEANNNNTPILCVARNVACGVRGGFFREFDEVILPRINGVLYEDELNNLPSAPDVGHFLTSAAENLQNGNKDPLFFDGMADTEVERRMKEANSGVLLVPPVSINFEAKPMITTHLVMTSVSSVPVVPVTQNIVSLTGNQAPQPLPFGRVVTQPEPSLQNSPAREEGEVAESEVDPDTRRRLLILQHGQDTRDPTPPFQVGPPLSVPVAPVQSRVNWYQEEKTMRSLVSNSIRQVQRPYFTSGDSAISSDRVLHETQRFPEQFPRNNDRVLLNHATSNNRSFAAAENSFNQRHQVESGRSIMYADSPVEVLQDIASRCGTKVDYHSMVSNSTELSFSFEIWLVGEKLGEGFGGTRKEAQYRAAENSLLYLSDNYISSTFSGEKPALSKDNNYLSDLNSNNYSSTTRDTTLPAVSTSEDFRINSRNDYSRRPSSSVTALKELCTVEGFTLVFNPQSSPSHGSASKDAHAQVEIGGQILGKGSGMTWEEAKLQAAAEALITLKSMLGQLGQKRAGSPRNGGGNIIKRVKHDFSRGLQRSTSGRYSKNESRVP